MHSGDMHKPTVTADRRPWFAERQATTDRGKTPLAWAPTEAAPKAESPRKKLRWPFALAGVAVAVAAGAIAYWRLSASGDDAPVEAAVTIPRPPDATTLADERDPWSSKGPKPTPQTQKLVPTPDPKSDDPWGGTTPSTKAGLIAEFPMQGPEIGAEQARKEIAAAIRHVPADTQFLFSASVNELRQHEQYKVVLDKLASNRRIDSVMEELPCLRSILSGSQWAVFAAKSLKEGNHGTLIIRGRWKRADVEGCFGHDIEELKMNDGAKILQLKHIGWLDFLDDHTVYLSVRDDLAAPQVHDLVKQGHGPTKRTQELLAKLPAKRSITAVADGTNGFEWPNDRLPDGSDATAWVLIGDDTELDVAVDTHDVAAANQLVSEAKPSIDELFKDTNPEVVGKLDVLRDKTTFRLRGKLTWLMIGMIVGALP
jgi:hypothetical protein